MHVQKSFSVIKFCKKSLITFDTDVTKPYKFFDISQGYSIEVARGTAVKYIFTCIVFIHLDAYKAMWQKKILFKKIYTILIFYLKALSTKKTM